MIASVIYDIEQYIISQVKCNAGFGLKDIGVDQMPYIRINVIDDFILFYDNKKTLTIDLPFELRIIVSKGNELKAIEVLERLLMKINQFKTHTGSKVEGTGKPEYIDDTDTYEISVLYNVKTIIQDTN